MNSYRGKQLHDLHNIAIKPIKRKRDLESNIERQLHCSSVDLLIHSVTDNPKYRTHIFHDEMNSQRQYNIIKLSGILTEL